MVLRFIVSMTPNASTLLAREFPYLAATYIIFRVDHANTIQTVIMCDLAVKLTPL